MSEDSRDFAEINFLRLELERAKAIYSLPDTHFLLARSLGDIWIDAVGVWGDNISATKFLLNEHPMFEGKRPFDIALSGEKGRERVRNHIGGIIHGIPL